jgi:tRNA A-37 threonylcarbamoyl transferase component Bud32
MGAHFPELDLLDLRGQGGMGVVYRARQRKLDRIVALKVLPRELAEDPAFSARFAREARTLARLQHPHIVGVHEFGERDGLFYLVMEYVDGVTLREIMSSGGLEPHEALTIVPQICEALQYAHDQGVVHRDIKPENILLDRAGRVKVADFGLAKLARRGEQDFTLTGTDQVMGTAHYMAPEQYRTPQAVDHRADIFSLGVVFYEMLTGDLPVGRFVKPSEVRSLDARIDEIVMRSLERERERRYQQAGEMRTAVTDYAVSTAQAAAQAPGGPPRAGATRHEARRGDDSPPLSGWARWGLCLLLAGPAVAAAVFWVSHATEDGGPISRDYHAWKAALFTALGFACAAWVVNVVGAFLTRRRAARSVRGHGMLVVGAIVSTLAVPTVVLALADQFRSSRHRLRQERLLEPIRGGSYAAQRSVRRGVNALWEAYTSRVRVRDLELEDMARFYDREDFERLKAMEPEERERLRRENRLGMGFVGAASSTYPPYHYAVREIRLGDWERTARVVAVHYFASRTMRTLTFEVKRAEGGAFPWVFSIGEVKIEE